MQTEKQIFTKDMEINRNELMVLGLGGTVDYEIEWSNSRFQELIDSYEIKSEEVRLSEKITSERELVCTILAYLKNSSGGEREVSDSEIVKKFSNRFDKKITLGGTGVRAALALEKFGVPTTLHLVSIDENVRRLLPENSPYICSAKQDSLDPHLIVQFSPKTNLFVENVEIKPDKADRIILTCDPPNEILLLSPNLTDVLQRAKIFLISGFNSIHEEKLLVERLKEIEFYAAPFRSRGLVFFEEAGYHRSEFRSKVMEKIAPLAFFYSMNEEEFQNYLGRKIDFFDSNDIATAVSSIQEIISVPILVVHTKYWSLVIGELNKKYVPHVQSGMTMATTRFIYGDDFKISDFKGVEELETNSKSAKIESSVNQLLGATASFIPAYFAEPENPTTIGLGDSFVGGFLLELSKDF